MPKVYNKNKDENIPADAIYIGRPSIYGNPYVIGKDGSRSQVIEKYRKYIETHKDKESIIHSLKDKDLVCFCSPMPCHGDVLLELCKNTDKLWNLLTNEQ